MRDLSNGKYNGDYMMKLLQVRRAHSDLLRQFIRSRQAALSQLRACSVRLQLTRPFKLMERQKGSADLVNRAEVEACVALVARRYWFGARADRRDSTCEVSSKHYPVVTKRGVYKGPEVGAAR